MKHVWIGTSWKMNKTLAEALDFARALGAAEAQAPACIQRFVVPPFTCVREVKSALADTSVMVGAQNVHWAEHGAWTGEISAPMLLDCGLDLVEIGHSERRAHFGETDASVGRKVAAAVRHGLIPLVCVGESLAEKEAGQADRVLERQVRAAFGRLPPNLREGEGGTTPLLLAYEPVWAIGEGGIPAAADYAEQRHAGIACVVQDLLGVPVPCLYGGSVDTGNCAGLIASEHIDGLFIGRAAWQVDGYLEILSRCATAMT